MYFGGLFVYVRWVQAIADLVRLSPTDLSSFLGCRHRTGLDLSAALGLIPKPDWQDARAQALRERGDAHERRVVESLRAQGLRVVDARDHGAAGTRAALADGVDVVVQAVLEGGESGAWRGYADVLRRVERPCAQWRWSYEVYDTKLARETRGGTILQLAVYSELLAHIQGLTPDRFHVVTPDPVAPVQSFRFADYAAYYRFIRQNLLAMLDDGPERIRERQYPEPVAHCETCRWWLRCNQQRRRDDHLSFIAGIGRLHRAELESQGVHTMAAAAALPIPIAFKPSRGSKDTYERLREQARVQVERRTTGRPVYELLRIEPGRGLTRLPTPSAGDLFLDLERASFAREGGRAYLFGLRSASVAYSSWWAFDDVEERAAFEAVIDGITQACADDPSMHVYHFGHSDATVLKHLAGRHATRGEALDRLLRAERFVDLHGIVRQAVRAGVESYSIKQLEPFYRFTRAVPLQDASAHLLAIELALEANAATAITEELRNIVQAYNHDDCRSAAALRDWLESLRTADVPRPEAKEGDASENVSALTQEAEAIRARLLSEIAPEAIEPGHPDHPQWLLAYLLDWHRREDKAQWWDYFRVRDLSDEDLLDEPKALVGLEFIERVDVVVHSRTRKPTGSVIDRYRYPNQEIDFGLKTCLKLRDDTRFGEVVRCDGTARTIDVRKGANNVDCHPSVVFAIDVITSDQLQRAVMRLADTPNLRAARRCGLDLLFRRPPRLACETGTGTFEQFEQPQPFKQREGESELEFAVRIINDLDRTTLALQGPPGAGKTYAGAQMIRALVRAGKRVGVAAVSHKVIRNLLGAIQKQAADAGEHVRLARKVNEIDQSNAGAGPEADAAILQIDDNDAALAALRDGRVDVLGGTAWLWAREEAAEAVDVLFVDEAGQMSLATALAVSQAAKSMVLLGDPQQLEQPRKGSHPDGVSVSALEHVLDGEKTMPPDRGIFLPVTWRLAPSLCAFTSELFYEGKLHARAGLERQRLVGTPAAAFDGAGMWWIPATHDGNQNWSREEIDIVATIVDQLLVPAARWIDADGREHQLTANDIRIVAPYNAQVNRLAERLTARGVPVPVGTVDKFQGQEAPVVIYSMTTSRAEDAPRGMEFLYSLNRLNVATSRARCAAILVASPRLFEPECRTPRQMLLANALCRFRELATQLV